MAEEGIFSYIVFAGVFNQKEDISEFHVSLATRERIPFLGSMHIFRRDQFPLSNVNICTRSYLNISKFGEFNDREAN